MGGVGRKPPSLSSLDNTTAHKVSILGNGATPLDQSEASKSHVSTSGPNPSQPKPPAPKTPITPPSAQTQPPNPDAHIDGLSLRFVDRPKQTEPTKPLVLHDHAETIEVLNLMLNTHGHTSGINKDGVCLAIASMAAQEAYLRDKGLQGTGFFEALDSLMNNPIAAWTVTGGNIDINDLKTFFQNHSSQIAEIPAKAFGPSGGPRTAEQLLACLGDGNAQTSLHQYVEHQALHLANDLQFLLFPGKATATQLQTWFPGSDLTSLGQMGGIYNQATLASDFAMLPKGTLCGINIRNHAMSVVRLSDGSWSYVDPNAKEKPKIYHSCEELAHAILVGAEGTTPLPDGFIVLSPFITPEDAQKLATPWVPLANLHLDMTTLPAIETVHHIAAFAPQLWNTLLQQTSEPCLDGAPIKFLIISTVPETIIASLPFMKDLATNLMDLTTQMKLRETELAKLAKITGINMPIVPLDFDFSHDVSEMALQNRTLVFAEHLRRTLGNHPAFQSPEDAIQYLKSQTLGSVCALLETVKPFSPQCQLYLFEQLLPEASPFRAMFRNMRVDARPEQETQFPMKIRGILAQQIISGLAQHPEKYDPADPEAAYTEIIKGKYEKKFAVFDAYFPNHTEA